MAREVLFGEQKLTLKLRGLLMFLAFKQKIILPYHTIKSVFVDYFDTPEWMIRMPGTSISPLNVYEGSFKYGDDWFFLSFERREPLVIIELEGHEKYRYVIFQIDNPTEIAARIRREIRKLH